MKHQLQQIREALESADEYQAENYHDYEGPRPAIAKALTALSELERMAVEPVAWKHDCAALLANDVELWIDNCPHCGRPRAAPPAKQPQARPDFNDEWTGYLKDGETPFERFLRERKDLDALAKLYQRALEENERLKAQQPQAEAQDTYRQTLEIIAVGDGKDPAQDATEALMETGFWKQPQTEAAPPANCRQRLAREGKLHPRSSCAVCGSLSPKWQECNLALAREGANK